MSYFISLFKFKEVSKILFFKHFSHYGKHQNIGLLKFKVIRKLNLIKFKLLLAAEIMNLKFYYFSDWGVINAY